jgi:hypothetical protein
MNNENKIQQAVIKDDRDYAIRKGRILERFTQEFHTRHRDNSLYRNVYEALIRDADPYEVIEKLIEINDEQFQKIHELIQLAPPTIGKTHGYGPPSQ